MQNSWSISEVYMDDALPITKNVAAKGINVGSRTRTRTKTTTRKKKKISGLNVSVQAIFISSIMVIFMICVCILFQCSSISTLNEEVRTMQKTLTEKQEMNDSRNGQIMSSMDLSAVEKTARGYGMTELTTSQYIYEQSIDSASTKTNLTGLEWLVNKNKE